MQTTMTLMIDGEEVDVTLDVEYDYQPGEPAITHLLPENCDPGTAPEVTITGVFCGNEDYSKYLTDHNREMLEQEIMEHEQDCEQDPPEPDDPHETF